jgi:hypothetical protein
MKQIGTCKIHLLSKAVSPITHMMGVSGNESIINREKILHDNIVKDIPVLSGNALRHRMIREPGAMELVEKCGLMGKLSIEQANYLFTGGSLTESSTTDNIKIIAEMQEAIPLYRLLGGSLKNQVIGGSLFVSRGLLVCEENKKTIKKLSSYDLPEDTLLSSQHFVGSYQYTRGDAGKMKDASKIMRGITEEDLKVSSNLMIYNGQSIIPGSLFYHNLVLYNVSPIEVGAALHCLDLWQNNGGTVGGSARIGHGKLKTDYWVEGLEDWFGTEYSIEQVKADYIQSIENNKEKIKKWLFEAFPTKETLL